VSSFSLSLFLFLSAPRACHNYVSASDLRRLLAPRVNFEPFRSADSADAAERHVLQQKRDRLLTDESLSSSRLLSPFSGTTVSKV